MKSLFRPAFLGVALIYFCASATGANAQENGVGADPDGDGNPATNTRIMVRIGAQADEMLDPAFRVITFEPPPGKHGAEIGAHYSETFGVTFGERLKQQICEGQRYFRYDSLCTYLAPPSGSYAAVYRDDWKRPLTIEFDKPICAASMAVYPTGGKEGERFQITVQPWKDKSTKLAPAKITLTWTEDTFRWRSMIGAFFNGADATRLEIMVESRDRKSDFVQFLIDDVAFVESGCDELLAEIENAAGYQTADGELDVAAN